MDCIFCKIVNGELPSAKIYEDDHQVAFLDAFPATAGHALLVPKKHIVNIFDCDEELGRIIYPTLIKLSKAIRHAMGCTGLNIVQNNEAVAGQVVFHSHIHLIPRYDYDGIKIAVASKAQATPEVLAPIADKIMRAL
ncbi:MAG: HIT family protein [Deferribacteraceae bacterium]|jgi:histidine triad (HIT) family protein|nr:HIT family protein [Deferribacteraceae bacterium]